MMLYPTPDDVGCFYTPSSSGWGRWGLNVFNPIFYYGKDPRAGTGHSPAGMLLNEPANTPGHPCPKPLGAWKWLLNKGSLDGETVLDPFMAAARRWSPPSTPAAAPSALRSRSGTASWRRPGWNKRCLTYLPRKRASTRRSGCCDVRVMPGGVGLPDRLNG